MDMYECTSIKDDKGQNMKKVEDTNAITCHPHAVMGLKIFIYVFVVFYACVCAVCDVCALSPVLCAL